MSERFLQAPAKLNLALAVGPPDSDSMHPICSWMVTVNLHDDLTVTRLADDRLSRYAILWHDTARQTSEIDWPVQSDLAVRAHLALERYVGRKLPIQLKLEKRIPVGGGLGGGSSDAAAMLRAVNDLFELDLTLHRLVEIGSTLGSDVPFLICGGSAIVEGMGERLKPLEDLADAHFILAFPPEVCPTGRVYRAFDQLGGGPLRRDAVQRLVEERPLRSEALFNDLTRAAIRIAPELEDHIAAIARVAERPAHLSGSGSTIFVPCDDAMHAEALALAIERRLEIPAVSATSTGRSVDAAPSPSDIGGL